MSEHLISDFLLQHRLVEPGEPLRITELAGGVSSDIWCVQTPSRRLCVKRALSKLKVALDWHAPIERNAYEWAWLVFAAQLMPDHVPTPLAHDPRAGLFAMSFLDPADHPVWKNQLLAGHADTATAFAVGALLARLHGASAGCPDVAEKFATLESFRALRLDPYLIASAQKHPELAPVLCALAQRTAAASIALVHGDVSPKNILVGPRGPIFLDAECAWYGDPAFDLAFCLNHLLLKSLVVASARPALRASFDALSQSYLSAVTWEAPGELERRAASLLPALLLARVDGKSPVEYLVGHTRQQAQVRAIATLFLRDPPMQLHTVADRWFAAIRL